MVFLGWREQIDDHTTFVMFKNHQDTKYKRKSWRKEEQTNKQTKMDLFQILILSSLFLLISTRFLLTRSNRKLKLPPSPAISLPVLGHLHLFKTPLHRWFLTLSKSIGNAPIFHLRLGNRLVYVVTSRSIAEECFTENDVVLANRPKFIVSKHVGYDATHLLSAPYGDHWRNLRRIAAVELLSTQRLNSFLYIRKDEIRRLISRLSRDSFHVRLPLSILIFILYWLVIMFLFLPETTFSDE